MKKFKVTKIFKTNLKTIIAIITTSLIVGCTTVFAKYNYFAKDVQYVKNDGTKISVEEAINSLYEEKENKNTWEKLFNIGFTIDEIVNTDAIFNKTIQNENDIEYMLKNTEKIMPSVVNSKVAMKIIGNNKNVYSKIFGNNEGNGEINSTWISNILNNQNAISALDQTNPVTVPNMTGYNTPYGEVKESSYGFSDQPGWKAFNNSNSGERDSWHSAGSPWPQWVQYKFTEPVLIYKVYLQNRYQGTTWVNAPQNFEIQASNDGKNWNCLGTYTNTLFYRQAQSSYIIQNINKRYYYYRIYVKNAKRTDGVTESGFVAIGRLQFYGK